MLPLELHVRRYLKEAFHPLLHLGSELCTGNVIRFLPQSQRSNLWDRSRPMQ